MKDTFSQYSFIDSKAGMTILYTVITIAAVITIGVSITGIYQRQSLLVSSSEASNKAFYAADAALECALEWDNRGEDEFADGANTIECAGDDSIPVGDCGGSCDYSFELDDTADASVCAEVSIEKEVTGGVDDPVATRIEARGRNTCQTNDRQAERALRTAY